MKTCLALRHVTFEDLGTLSGLLARRGVAVTVRDIGVEEPTEAEVEDADLVIVLGGPIGVYEEDAYPFLTRETALIARRLGRPRPTLGLCLGAQLMAKALGSRVAPGPQKEIGWGPVELTPAGRASPLRHLDGVPVLHWHGDNLDAPAEAETLAATGPCPCQAFAKGPNLLGLQFHVEADPGGIERWLIGHAVELAKAGIDPRAIRADTLRHGPGMVEIGMRVIDEWLDGVEP